ncbi:MAG: HAD family hydrolase [Lachnospiraceae bacterium]
MKNLKRVFAIFTIVLLLSLYIITFILSLQKSPQTQPLFMISLLMTILVPIFLYICLTFFRYLQKQNKKIRPDGAVDTIIFDVGKVLVAFEWIPYLKSLGYDDAMVSILSAAVFESPVWEAHDQGLLSDEEYLDAFIANAPAYEEDIRNVFAHDGQTITPFEYAETWVRYLSEQGYKLFILSNFAHNTFIQAGDKMTFRKYMDGEIFSFQVKQVKPEPDIYNTLLNLYNIEPSCAVFIDDRQENLATAQKMGLHTILFTDFKSAVKELKKLGVN